MIKTKEMLVMQVNINLNALLQDKNISHREFSRMTGIRHPSISDMCNNETKRIPLDNLAKICEILECDISDILKLEPK